MITYRPTIQCSDNDQACRSQRCIWSQARTGVLSLVHTVRNTMMERLDDSTIGGCAKIFRDGYKEGVVIFVLLAGTVTFMMVLLEGTVTLVPVLLEGTVTLVPVLLEGTVTPVPVLLEGTVTPVPSVGV